MTATLIISLTDPAPLAQATKQLTLSMSIPPSEANIETVLTMFRGMVVTNIQALLSNLADEFQEAVRVALAEQAAAKAKEAAEKATAPVGSDADAPAQN